MPLKDTCLSSCTLIFSRRFMDLPTKGFHEFQRRVRIRIPSEQNKRVNKTNPLRVPYTREIYSL